MNNYLMSMPLLQIRKCKWLHPLPKMEKERFAGGRNLSAIDRNMTKKTRARSEVQLVHLTLENVLVVPDWMFDEVRDALAQHEEGSAGE
jgi:hypothetical protein